MAKKYIFANTPVSTVYSYVVTDSPLTTSSTYSDGFIYNTTVGDPNNVDTKLAALRAAHPSLSFDSGNPGTNPPPLP